MPRAEAGAAPGAAALPPPVAGWPAVLRAGGPGAAADGAAAEALARVRAGTLWWPVPRRGARRGRVLALTQAHLAQARAAHPGAAVLLADDPAGVDPEGLEAVFGPASHPALLWAAMGGLAAPGAPGAAGTLARSQGLCPWTGGPLDLAAAVEAQALLRAAALRARGPVALVAMSPWKRRCLRPFLTGPDGPPQAARSAAQARARGLVPVLWGDAGPEEAAGTVLRVEDGFLRSAGLGLRHVPPLSLAIGAAPPHFDATRPNGFEALAAAADYTPELKARARRLAARIVELELTKYCLDGKGAPPDPQGREAVLVAGQVESDASIRLGARAVRTNLALLEAARARFPRAFLLYRPHPDVLTGLRPGAVPAAAAARLADAQADGLTAEACLAWADRVATMTSLIGFEALLRGKAVTVYGRPFYAGWGLTDDADPPPRPRALALDELAAAALLLYPSYVDPASGLPAPAEIAVAALARERIAARRPLGRLRQVWRHAVSSLLSRL